MAHNNQKRGRNQRRRPSQNNINKSMDSNGPDVKIRGTIVQIHDKYQNLARDAQSSGDRIRAESLLQHAEHYYRLIRMLQPKEPAAADTPQPEGHGSDKSAAIGQPEGETSIRRNVAADSNTHGEPVTSGQMDADEVMSASEKAPGRKSSKQSGRKRAPRKSLAGARYVPDIQPGMAAGEEAEHP